MSKDKEKIILILGAFLYLVLLLISLLTDPLVLAPQLDAKENLELSVAFEQGNVAEEPFYRAVLYPWLLSFVDPVELRPLLGGLLGMALHLLNAWMVAGLARRLWNSETAAWLAALLYLLNPASLFYAAQLLDMTLGISLFLAGLLVALRGNGRALPTLAAGTLLALACLVRPHFLPVVLVTPLALMLASGWRPWAPAAAWLPLVVVLLIHGGINHRISGDFRMLPWQGAYNLWAANKPGANGLYYKQVLDLAGRGDNTNPAKVESVTLYAAAHPGEEPPYSIDDMNHYWRGRFVDYALDHPVELAGLWFRKAYAVVNNFEQYNNLTFSFHKARISALRCNPIGWGLLFAVGAAGFIHLARTRPGLAIAWALIVLAYASMLILFYASARFRLPLVPLVAVMGGGAAMLVRDVVRQKRLPIPEAVAALVAALLTFSTFGDIRSRDTFVQDRLLMANAHAELGEDAAAADYARRVLDEHPGRAEAQRIYAVSYFNMRLVNDPAWEAFGGWDAQADWVRWDPPTDPVQDAVYGVFLWQWGDRDDAVRTWQSVVDRAGTDSLAGACLIASGVAEKPALLNSLENALEQMLLPVKTAP